MIRITPPPMVGHLQPDFAMLKLVQIKAKCCQFHSYAYKNVQRPPSCYKED